MSNTLEAKGNIQSSEAAEHKRLENLLDNQQQVLKLIAKGADLLKTLDLIARMVEKFSDNKMFASILLLDQKSKKNLNHGAAPSLPKTYIRAINGMKIGPNAGSCGTAAYTKKQIIVSDITTDPLWKDFKQLALKHKLRACWSTPILASNGKVLGTFALYYRQPRKPSPEDKKLIRIMTQTTALAIERKRADEERQELLSREKVAHAEAENERRRINSLFMQAPALIAVLRGREGTCELLNPSFSAMWGNRSVVGKKMREAWPELEGQGWFEMVEKINDTGESISNNEKSAIADWHNDGRLTEKFFNFVYTPYRTPEGKVAGVMIFGNEVTEQVLARRKVEESEARFRAVFNQAAVAISITGLNGKWITLNKAYPKMLGYTEAELKKLDYTTLTHPDDRAADKEAVTKLLSGEKSTYIREKRYIHKNGSIVWALIHVALIKNEKGEPQYMTAAIKDITRRKQIEESLQISELRYRTMIEQSPLSIQILSTDGRTLQVNKAWEELWGASLEQMKDYNMLKDTQLTELGIMPYIKKGFKGEPTVIPAVRYEPNKTIENVSEIPYRWVRAFIYPVKDSKGTIREVVLVHDDITEQKQVEEALQQSEERFKNAFAYAWVGVAVTDAEGKFVYVNPAYEKITGYSLKELSKLTFSSLIHPEDYEKNMLLINRMLKGKIPGFTIENRYMRKGKTPVWVRKSVSVVRDKFKNVQNIIAISEDITERKRSEEKLQYQKNLLEAQQEASPLGILVVSPTGKILTYNQRFAAMWKFPKKIMQTQLDEVALQAAKEQLTDPEAFLERVAYCYANKAHDYTQLNFKDGRVFDRYGTPIMGENQIYRGHIWFFLDISDRKKAEADLKKSEERMRFMAESMPQKIFTATPDGKVNYYNPQWMEYTGLSFEQMKDWGWTQFVHPDDVKENVKQWRHSVETGEPFQLEHRFRHKNGEYHWHLSRALPMRDKHGNVTLWIGSNTDIHDIKTALERERKLKEKTDSLAEQRTQLIALNRAKDEFISLASHQLRTPATGVKQYLGMVLEGYVGELTPSQQEMLELAEDSNERQIQIINDLLQIAHIDAGQVKLHKKPIDLVNLLEDVLSEHSSKFHKRHQKIIFKHKPGKLIAVVDEPRMRMILDNLLDNASKYSHDNKTITVELSKSKDTAKIAIQDEGVGMKKKDISKLFRKFSRLDNPLSVMAGGTGLGLYWVKKIVDLHGGSITVDSKLNKGSTFTVTVPA
jgi:PAS domain S-box-containing protein